MSELNKIKVFTVEEARRLTPRLTELLKELQVKRASIAAQEVEIDALELVTEQKEGASAPVLDKSVEKYNHTIARFYALIDEIQSFGCFLKDIDLGLIDFYTIYQGRVVYLCWKMGEREVEFWHEVGRGYSYRHPIEHDHHERESS
ncbi:MAG TPA: DUF2203 domain-containing protein, partial [bacterium]|nr:DUF2203 domain-containing protein [bacterium]